MKRLSVVGAIRFAYVFVFEQIGAIIGLVWLPLVFVAILQFLPYAIGTAYPGTDPSKEGGAAALNLTFFMAAFLLYAMNCVAVTRQALGLRQGAASLHFLLGWPEWKMFAAIIICLLLLGATIGIYARIGAVISVAAGRMPGLAIAAEAYTILGLCGVVWLALRLFFLLPPIVVVEERVDFLRAWLVSRGNAWRILVVMLAVIVPIVVIQAAAIVLIVGPGVFAPLPASAEAMNVALQARIGLIDRHMASIIGLTLVLAPFSLGLTLGASAYAYRSLAADRLASKAAPPQ
jgi:hypothetical protein